MLTHVDLFSGIGGFALACRWAGVETIAFAEIDSYASRVLERHWPNVRNYGDVRNVPAIRDVWLVTGGVPCQPASVAGKRLGTADDRWLWPEALAAVERIRPAWVLFENPTGILSLNDGLEFERICLALEGQGYEVQPIVIPAAAVRTNHRRDRCWIIANANNERRVLRRGAEREHENNLSQVWSPAKDQQSGSRRKRRIESVRDARNPAVAGLPDWAKGTMGKPSPLTEFERPSGREIERDFCGMAYGVSRRVDRLRTLGNAIVPQVSFQLIKRMIDAERLQGEMASK